jgi:hypothetical protein
LEAAVPKPKPHFTHSWLSCPRAKAPLLSDFHYEILNFLKIVFIVLGYIVKFAKVLIIYHSWIHLLCHSPLPSLPYSWHSFKSFFKKLLEVHVMISLCFSEEHNFQITNVLKLIFTKIIIKRFYFLSSISIPTTLW